MLKKLESKMIAGNEYTGGVQETTVKSEENKLFVLPKKMLFAKLQEHIFAPKLYMVSSPVEESIPTKKPLVL